MSTKKRVTEKKNRAANNGETAESPQYPWIPHDVFECRILEAEESQAACLARIANAIEAMSGHTRSVEMLNRQAMEIGLGLVSASGLDAKVLGNELARQQQRERDAAPRDPRRVRRSRCGQFKV